VNDKAIKVLLIEDNPGDTRLIREMLKEAGAAQLELVCTDRLSTGLERLAEGGIDVILLDLELPGSQGLDTLGKVLAEPPEAPVIVVLTGLDDEALAIQAVREGAQDYLVKGQVDGNLLVRAMHYAIERKRAEEELKEYSERLEEMVEERTKELRDAQEQLVRREKLVILGQLAGGVGHELRNPLGVISNAVYFLQFTLPDADETTKEYLDIISTEVRNSTKIISDLLDFSRTRLPEREEAAVSDLVAEVLKKQPPPEEVEAITEIAPDLPPVHVDPQQIGLVLANLVVNAYQAMKEEGTLTIKTSEVSEKLPKSKWVALSVSDTGCGISPENMAKLFEPLFTTKARGIGLGLAVSRILVEANGGSMEVESEKGKGSTFTVRLPVAEGRD